MIKAAFKSILGLLNTTGLTFGLTGILGGVNFPKLLNGKLNFIGGKVFSIFFLICSLMSSPNVAIGNFNFISGNGLGGKSFTTGLGLLSILLLGKTNFGTGVSSAQKSFFSYNTF